MKKFTLAIIILFSSISTMNASHVIGGDFHIQMVSQQSGGADYHIKLRAYRDDVNGIPLPATITIGVYQVGTNTQVATQVLNKTNPLSLVPLGDPCYTPDTSLVRIEEGIFESPTNLFLPNYGSGYYISTQIAARNSLAVNVAIGGTMTWFAMIPNPAIGQNSTPDFGNYPTDAYFCVNNPKSFSYPIFDADGDSLAYALVAPLDAAPQATGTFAGVGSYPYYPALAWQVPYNLANVVGGTPPMTIDASTGLITASPSIISFFTFAIRVEEFRDTTLAQTGPKVKIGEVRRDVQYISLACTGSSNNASFNYVDNGNANYSFTNTSTGSYTLSRWNFGDGGLSPIPSPNHTFSNDGTYVVVLAIADSSALSGANCSMDYAVSTINVTGVVNPLACNAGFTIYPDSAANNVFVVNSSTGNNLTYHWDFDDGDTSNLQYPSHTYSSGGPFYLCLTIDNGIGCIDTFCDSISSGGVVFKQSQSGFTINTIGTGITGISNNVTQQSLFNVYPNPGETNVSIESNRMTINEITIVDVTGKVIKSINDNFNFINVSDLSKGVYFLQIRTKDRLVTKKFIKE